MQKRVLITGSSGFLGRNLEEQLRDQHILFTSPHSDFDLTNLQQARRYFQRNPVDVVVHCAAVGARGLRDGKASNLAQQPEITCQNLGMLFNLMDSHPGKIISFGSGAEYDKTYEIKGVKEEEIGKFMPTDPYSFSKYAMSRVIESSDRDMANLRLFAVYGRYENHNVRFMARSICRNLLGLPIVIHQNAVFDYLYVDDAVKIVDHFIRNSGRHRTYNVGMGIPVDLLSVAQEINRVAKRKSEIVVTNPGFKNEYTCDNSRLMEEMGDFKFTPLAEGIRRMYEYYAEHIDEIDTTGVKN